MASTISWKIFQSLSAIIWPLHSSYEILMFLHMDVHFCRQTKLNSLLRIQLTKETHLKVLWFPQDKLGFIRLMLACDPHDKNNLKWLISIMCSVKHVYLGRKGPLAAHWFQHFLKKCVSDLIDLIIPSEIFIADSWLFTRMEILFLCWQFLLFPGLLLLTLLILPYCLRITNRQLLTPLVHFICFLNVLASPVFLLMPLYGEEAKRTSQVAQQQESYN